MNNRLRLFLVILAILCAGNAVWRIWTNWGLVTVDATDRPLSEVTQSIEHQAGIRMASNLPGETKVTMHVRKVPLLHALDVLAAAANANWSLGYFAAADKAAIDQGIASFSSGEAPAGWKRFSLPPMRGMGFDVGSSDPRQDRWDIQAIPTGGFHAYLNQGSLAVSAQFWTPEAWDPVISAVPKPGKVGQVLPRLAKAAHGSSTELFLLSGQPAFPRPMASPDANTTARPGGGFGPPGGMPSEEMRKSMEDRMLAQINKLPADKKAEALAEFESRKKVFAEMANLTPEERKAKMQELMEKGMNDSQKASKFESQMTQRGAMKTADQRNDFYRQALTFKNKFNQ